MAHSQSVVPPNSYETPSIVQFFQRGFMSLDKLCFQSDGLFDMSFALRMVASIQLFDVLVVLLIAVIFTCLRYAVTEFVSLPLARSLRVSRKHGGKWSESMWKCLAYSALWLLSLYVVVLSGKYDFLQNPLDIFKGFAFGDAQLLQPVPGDIYCMYALQLGFYVHSIFGTLFMDAWRKDSVMMIVHHALTIFLLEFSFVVRYYKIGALVLFLHDLSDILLEFTKIHVYLKDRAKQVWLIHEWIANVGFVMFSISWAWFRLYWYPLKVLYTTTWGVYIHHRESDHKLVLFFNSMLIALQILHIYWFCFILLLLMRVATGTQRELEDTREFDEHDAAPAAAAAAAAAVQASGDHRVDHSHSD